MGDGAYLKGLIFPGGAMLHLTRSRKELLGVCAGGVCVCGWKHMGVGCYPLVAAIPISLLSVLGCVECKL